jgi:KaiC/GvpD/RAD55 family RecA-like ATPase
MKKYEFILDDSIVVATNTRQAAIKALPISDRFLKPISFLMEQKISIKWLIRGYLPLESTTMIYGESGAGKTFAVLDMALHIATGKEWQGHKTKQGLVIYIAGEGQMDINARAEAWAQYHDVDNMPNFLCTSCAFIPTNEAELLTLTDNIDVAIEESGQQPVLIVFDTISRCFDGNENSSQDASAYIRAKDRLKQKYGACVLSVNNISPKEFRWAWDAEHCLSLNDWGIELSTVKMKEAEPLPPKYFKLESVTLNGRLDKNGREVKSLVLVE